MDHKPSQVPFICLDITNIECHRLDIFNNKHFGPYSTSSQNYKGGRRRRLKLMISIDFAKKRRFFQKVPRGK